MNYILDVRAAVKKHTLDTNNADAFRRLLATGKPPSLEELSGITLPGAMELFATAMAFPMAKKLRAEIEASRRLNPLWDSLAAEWTSQPKQVIGSDAHGTRRLEAFRLALATDQTSHHYQLFQERMVRSLQQVGGFTRDFAYALAGVLAEMTDNVIQHSGENEGKFSGLAAYHIRAPLKTHSALTSQLF